MARKKREAKQAKQAKQAEQSQPARLRELRLLEDGLSQAKLAGMAGVTQSYISTLENDPEAWATVSIGILNRIAKALDRSPAELIDYTFTIRERISVVGEVGAGLWKDEPFWREERHYVARTLPDTRYEKVKRFGLEIATIPGAQRSIAFFVPAEAIPGPLELDKKYLVERRNEEGQYELTIRLLEKKEDGKHWLTLAYEEAASEADKAPILFHKNSPTVKIIARVSTVTHFE